jgi:hypothetical protein
MGLNVGFAEQDLKENDSWVDDGLHASIYFGVGVNF